METEFREYDRAKYTCAMELIRGFEDERAKE
jgi:hypothetical protein